MAKEFATEIVALEKVSSNVMKLCLNRADGEKQIKLDSGQFYDLQIPGTEITRSYSPANISNNEGQLEFLIRLLDGGQFSSYLTQDAKLNQSIQVKGLPAYLV